MFWYEIIKIIRHKLDNDFMKQNENNSTGYK